MYNKKIESISIRLCFWYNKKKSTLFKKSDEKNLHNAKKIINVMKNGEQKL